MATLFLLGLLATAVAAETPDDLRCLDAVEIAGRATPPGELLYADLLRRAHQVIDRRKAEYETVKTVEQARAWQERRRELFQRQIGGEWPARTPLDARVVGLLDGGDYRVEKVIYASRPGHHVTGVLYLPKTPPPYPGVIIPCGHSHNGKAAEAYQRVGILLAKHGIAALCYDPIGQGERYQLYGPSYDGVKNEAARPNSRKLLEQVAGRPEFDPVEEHTLIGVTATLVGWSTAYHRIWDGMRSLDYLASRPDVDPKRLGCTGNSGGGTLTAYLMALDERIVCAAPACYLTTFRRLLDGNGPQDAEQNVYGQLTLGFDQADFPLLRAPKPTLLLAGTRDVTFDIEGTWDIFRESKRFFARFDLPENVDLVESDAPHGFTVQLRTGAVRWMQRWLLGIDKPVVEPDFPVWKPAELQCTPLGQVMSLDGERSVFDLHRERERELAERRRKYWEETTVENADERRALVRSRLSMRAPAPPPEVRIRERGRVRREGYRIDRLLLETDGAPPVPALAFIPERPADSAVLYLHDGGKQADAAPGGPIERLVRGGRNVLAIDVRGTGETASGRPRDWSRALFGPNGQEFFLAYLLGESIVGLRVEDVQAGARAAARYGAEGGPAARPVDLIATGDVGVAALHALALDPSLARKLTLRGALQSYVQVLDAKPPREQLTEAVHGVLDAYDLPDLVRLVGAERVIREEPIAP